MGICRTPPPLVEHSSALQVNVSLSVMGCWCSKEDETHQPTLTLSSLSNGASTQRGAPGMRAPELSVPEEHRRRPMPPGVQRSPMQIDTASAQQTGRKASSQRTADAWGCQNPERSPNTATPSSQNIQNAERVLAEFDELRSSVVDFVHRCLPQSSEFLRSKSRRKIYKSVLKDVEKPKDPQSCK